MMFTGSCRVLYYITYDIYLFIDLYRDNRCYFEFNHERLISRIEILLNFR